jgi:hypothetical protein
MMTLTKRTAELVKGDVVLDEAGRAAMTVRKVAPAVDRDLSRRLVLRASRRAQVRRVPQFSGMGRKG